MIYRIINDNHICISGQFEVLLKTFICKFIRRIDFHRCNLSLSFVLLTVKITAPDRTQLNSTQLVESSPIERCVHNPRLISTQLVQLSQVP